MKMSGKWALAVVSSSVLVLGGVVRADTYYTYRFDAAYNSTYPSVYSPDFNGSTLTVDATTGLWVGWDLTDGTYTLDSSLTAATATATQGALIVYPGPVAADASGFLGYVAIFGITGSGVILEFLSDDLGPSFHGPSVDSYTYSLNSVSPSVETYGNWTPVPDAANTFELLMGCAGVLGVCRRRMGAGWFVRS